MPRIFFLLLLIIQFQVSRGQIFDTIFKHSKDERIDIAGRALNNHILPMDSAEAQQILLEFRSEAERKADYHTQSIALAIMGIHYGARSRDQREKGLEHMREALRIAKKHDDPLLEAKIYHQLGFCYFSMEQSEEGLFALLNANRIMRKVGYENVPYITDYLTDIGAVYYDFGNFRIASQFLYEISQFTVEKQDKMLVYARLGLSYQKMQELDSALYYFQKALAIAEKSEDSLHIGMYLGNVGTIYLEQGRLDEALDLLIEDYRQCMKYAQAEPGNDVVWLYASAARSLISQADIYLQQDQYKKAKEKIDEAQEIIDNFRINRREMKSSLYNLSAQIYAYYGQYDKAYENLDSSRAIRKYLQRNFDRNMLANIETQLASQEHMSQVALLEQEKYAQRIIRNTAIALIVLMILLFSSLIVNLRSKHKRKQRIYALEKQKAEEKLADFKKRIRDKNRLIESFEQKFNDYKLALEETEERRGDLDQLYEQIILTDDDWMHFKRDFENAYPGFMQQLMVKYPQLTPAEIRLLTLIKLNLSSKEIAKTLGISPESVRKTRHRVMKKLGISDHKQLPVFVAAM